LGTRWPQYHFENNLICGKKGRVAKLKINFAVARLHPQQ
jgi:hypothetical protein